MFGNTDLRYNTEYNVRLHCVYGLESLEKKNPFMG